MEKEIKKNIHQVNSDKNISTHSKKQEFDKVKLEDINLFTENDEVNKLEGQSNHKHTSAPASNKHSDGAPSIFTNTMKMAAFRASKFKSKNKKLIIRYGDPDRLKDTKYELSLLKKLHNAAFTIQNFWRDYLLRRKSSMNSDDQDN
jgi:phage protein D